MRGFYKFGNVFVRVGKFVKVNQSRYKPGVAQRFPGS